jgi:hypothetical protein
MSKSECDVDNHTKSLLDQAVPELARMVDFSDGKPALYRPTFSDGKIPNCVQPNNYIYQIHYRAALITSGCPLARIHKDQEYAAPHLRNKNLSPISQIS